MGARLAPARSAALAVLGDIRRHQAHARDALRNSTRLGKLSVQDVALVERLVLGVSATLSLLDKLYGAYLSKKSSLEPRVRDALRLATFELCYLSTPQAVAVSQGVELVRSVAPRAAGLANAVLRKVGSIEADRITKAREELSSRYLSEKNGSGDTDSAPEQALSLVAGWPVWLTRRIVQSVGFSAAYKMACCTLDAAPLWVSGNTALHTAEQTQELLRSLGLEPLNTPLPDVFRLPFAAGLGRSGLVSSGDLVVSDLSARLIVLLASPRPGSHVLEIGQGRGTKTLLLEAAASQRGGPATIVGVDKIPFKVRVAEKRLRSWQPYVICLEADACALSGPVAGLPAPDREDGLFDEVFVDAPCSGTGTLRRHPEIAWSLSEDALDPHNTHSLPVLQQSILRAAATRVRAGGILVYSTCSVLKEECEDVVQAFLNEQSDKFVLIPADEAAQQLPDDVQTMILRAVTPDGMFASRPAEEGPDGHFCALFRNIEKK